MIIPGICNLYLLIELQQVTHLYIVCNFIMCYGDINDRKSWSVKFYLLILVSMQMTGQNFY